MEAIILAGGLGTRLASRLNGIPKPMAPVAGHPFLEFLLATLERSGCTRAVLSTGHLAGVIEQHFGKSYRGLALEYSVESSPLGTGGAIREALKRAREERVLVLNGDTFLPVDYGAMLAFAAEAGPLTMAVSEQPDVARYGEVLLRGDQVAGFREKGRSGPGWINAGVYAIQRDFPWPAAFGEKFSFETGVLTVGVATIAAFRCRGLFLDIGVPEDLDRAQTELLPWLPGRSIPGPVLR